MDHEPSHYQLPENTDIAIRRMAIGLGAFFVVLTILVGLMLYYAQSLAQMIPFSAEQRFVRPYEKLFSIAFDVGAGDSETERYLQTMIESLSREMELPEDLVVKVHYLEADEINAFATLGGHIVVLSGLVDALPDENSLAMVLAHELAHIAHRDPLAAVGRGTALQLLLGLVTGETPSSTDAADLINATGMNLFSREQERSADLAALHTLAGHYGHVRGYRELFDIMLNDERKRAEQDSNLSTLEIPAWLSSHPGTQERIDNLDAAKLASGYTRQAAKPLPDFTTGNGNYKKTSVKKK